MNRGSMGVERRYIVSSYSLCEGSFFKNVFEKYSLCSEKKMKYVESENLLKRCDKSYAQYCASKDHFSYSSNICSDIQKRKYSENQKGVVFLYNPYSLIIRSVESRLREKFHEDVEDKVGFGLLRDKNFQIRSAFEKQIQYEVDHIKKKINVIYKDFSLDNMVFVDIERLFFKVEQQLQRISGWLGLDIKLFSACFAAALDGNKKFKKSRKLIKHQRYFNKNSYNYINQVLPDSFFVKFTQKTSNYKPVNSFLITHSDICISDTLNLLYCNKNKPSLLMLGRKYIEEGYLILKGWFISPYVDCYLEITYSNGEKYRIFAFEEREEVRNKYPDYNQNGRGFYFKQRINDGSNFVRVDINSKAKNIKKTFLSVDSYGNVKQSIVEHYKTSTLNYSNKSLFNERFLLITKCFDIDIEQQNRVINNLFYCLAEIEFVNEINLLELVKLYKFVYIEESLYLALDKQNIEKIKKINSIAIIKDITIKKEIDQIKIGFLCFGKTQIDLIKKISNKFKNKIFIVLNKDKGACELLEKLGYNYISIVCGQKESLELSEYKPNYILSLTDWGTEYLDIVRMTKSMKCKYITLQENLFDWDFQFSRKESVCALNRYRNCDVFLSQGIDVLRYVQPKYFSIVGTPNMNYEQTTVPIDFQIAINCFPASDEMFSSCKSQRVAWLNSVLKVCNNLGIKYIILQNFRDFCPINNKNLIKTNTSSIKKYLKQSSVVVSRVSTVFFESLSYGVDTICFDPHKDSMITVRSGFEDVFNNCSTESELSTKIKKIYVSLTSKKRRDATFKRKLECLNYYMKNINNKSIERIVDVLSNIGSRTLGYNKAVPIKEDHEIHICKEKKCYLVFSSNKEPHEENYQIFMFSYFLALSGHKVYFCTDSIPIFFDDIKKMTPLSNFHFINSNLNNNSLPFETIDELILSFYSDFFNTDLPNKNLFKKTVRISLFKTKIEKVSLKDQKIITESHLSMFYSILYNNIGVESIISGQMPSTSQSRTRIPFYKNIKENFYSNSLKKKLVVVLLSDENIPFSLTAVDSSNILKEVGLFFNFQLITSLSKSIKVTVDQEYEIVSFFNKNRLLAGLDYSIETSDKPIIYQNTDILLNLTKPRYQN